MPGDVESSTEPNDDIQVIHAIQLRRHQRPVVFQKIRLHRRTNQCCLYSYNQHKDVLAKYSYGLRALGYAALDDGYQIPSDHECIGPDPRC